MRILVCGGRDYCDFDYMFKTLDAVLKYRGISLVIEGGARGADTLARQWAQLKGIPFVTEYAQWDTYGKAAGSIRNQAMLDKYKPDAVIAFPGGIGTADMIRRSEASGLIVWKR